MPSLAEHYLRNIERARDCAAFGARSTTIHTITGIPPPQLQRLFFRNPEDTPRGRTPHSSSWWLHSANLPERIEASICLALFRQLRRAGFAPADALISAYRSYRSTCEPPYRINFDRAFDLASHIEGIWCAESQTFDVVTCASCESDFLSMAGIRSAKHCPFCSLMNRYSRDPRLQRSFPLRPVSGELEAAHAELDYVFSRGASQAGFWPGEGSSAGEHLIEPSADLN